MLKQILNFFFSYKLDTHKKPWKKKSLNHRKSDFPMAKGFTTDQPVKRGNINFYNPGFGGNDSSVLWAAASAIYGWVKKNRPDKAKLNQLKVAFIADDFKAVSFALSQFDLLTRDMWVPLDFEFDAICAGKLKENQHCLSKKNDCHETLMSSARRYCSPQYKNQIPYDLVVICADIREKQDVKDNSRHYNSSASTIYRVEDGFWKEVADLVKDTRTALLTCSPKPSYVPFNIPPDDEIVFRIIHPAMYDS